MLIFISGPYRGNTDANIAEARQWAIMLWQAGHYAICPHLNTAHFERDCLAPDDRYLAGYIEILRRCDAIMMIPGWRDSEGARAEYEFAIKNNIKVLYAAG